MANTTSLQTLKEMLGAEWQIGEDCVYTESNGIRFEVFGACCDSHKSYFNVCVTRNGDVIAQTIAVPQETLVSEVEVLRQLIPKQ